MEKSFYPCLCRSQPPDYILQKAKYTSKYYRLSSAAPHSGDGGTNGQPSAFELLKPYENEAVSFSNVHIFLFFLYLFVCVISLYCPHKANLLF
jgi:hypothetical protein